MHTLVKGGISIVLFFSPFLAFAATPQNISQLIGVFTNLFLLVIPIVFAIGLLVFFWGLAKFVFFSTGSEEGRSEGRRLMMWGTIALFVMLSVWGFVRILQETVFGTTGAGNTAPTSRTHFDNTNLLNNP